MNNKMRVLLTVATTGFAAPSLAQTAGSESVVNESKMEMWTAHAIEPVNTVPRTNQHRSSKEVPPRLANLHLAESATNEGSQQSLAAESARNSGSARRRSSREMEEVVVTAQKREEFLKDVPISMAVLEGYKLDSSTSQGVTDALARVAGVGTVSGMTTSGTFVSVRGVSNGGALYSGANVVAYYIDSAPHGLVRSPIAPDSSAYDLAQVEVLRGPQGTLYGASALSGVVRVLTEHVNTNEFEVKARASGSSTEGGDPSYRGDMAMNVPIIDGRLGARAVFGYQDLGGWIDRPNKKNANSGEIRNMRLKVAALPIDDLSIEFAAWFSRADYDASNYSNNEGRHTSSLVEEPYGADFDSYSVKVDYQFNQFSIRSTTSYLDYGSLGTVDLVPQGEPFTLVTDLDSRVLSQELLLSSNEKTSWRWTFGLFYRDGEDLTHPLFGGTQLGVGSTGSESYAVFGEVGRKFFHNKFGWTLGMRYFHDDVFISDLDVTVTPPLYERAEQSFHATTPRAVLTWYPNDDVTVYGTYSEGFRSGFEQGIGLLAQYPEFGDVKPDTLRNYEIGAKGDLLNGRLLLEGAVYYTDWTDLQQQLQVPIFVNGVASGLVAVVNSGSASGAGVELSATARPAEGLDLGLSFGWNDLSMDAPVTTLSTGVPVRLFDKGDRLNQSPEYTFGGFVDYLISLGETGYEGQLSVSANHTSRLDAHAIPGGFTRSVVAHGDEITLARVSFAVRAPSNWVATLFVDNINNEDGAVAGNTSVNPAWTARVRPRTVGLQFEYQY